MTKRKALQICLILLVSPACFGATGISGLQSDRDLRAYPGSREDPIEVRFNFFLLNVLHIDDVGQTMTLDYLISMSWKDPRLADSAMADPSRKNTFELKDIWNPAFAPVNLYESKPQDKELTIDSEGNVTYRFRNIDTFVSPLDLRHFPFDRQTLRMKFISRLYGPEFIRLVWLPNRSGRLEESSTAGWDFHKMDVAVGSERLRTIEGLGREVGTIGISLELSRESSFYVWKVIFPLALIVFMAWTVFWIDPTELSAQLGIASASVITMIAFQLSLSELLPKISYLTRIDFYALGTSGLVFLSLGEAILTARLASTNRKELSRSIDQVMRVACPALYLVILLIVVV